MTAIKLVSMGTDPEFFVVDTRGRLVNPARLTGGTKGNAEPIAEPGRFGIGALVDGAAVELNTKLPALNADDWRAMLRDLALGITSLAISRGYDWITKSSVLLSSYARRNPQYNEIGCATDYDAYTGQAVPRITPRALKGWRHAGGHIHAVVEADDRNLTFDDACRLVRLLDVTVGINDRSSDERRAYIGAGRFRLVKLDGRTMWVEYRTPCSGNLINNISGWRDVDLACRMFNGEIAKAGFPENPAVLYAKSIINRTAPRDALGLPADDYRQFLLAPFSPVR